MARPKARGSRVRPESSPAGPSRLWAPWRATWIIGQAPRFNGCIFCPPRLDAAARRRGYVLYADALALVMLNAYPYNNGHLMIAPRRHVASPESLEPRELAAIDRLTVDALKILRRVLNPAGFNLGANLGAAAGAGIADHIHWHIVPRWNGDTNFMPALASVRVLSQHLRASYKALAPLFKKLDAAIS